MQPTRLVLRGGDIRKARLLESKGRGRSRLTYIFRTTGHQRKAYRALPARRLADRLRYPDQHECQRGSLRHLPSSVPSPADSLR